MNAGQRIARLGLIVSVTLALLKIVTGFLSHSSALLADGVESAGDAVASAVIVLGLTVAALPPDENHPYGHGRAETLSGLLLGLFLFLTGAGISTRALITARSVAEIPALYAIWPLIISIGFKLWLVRLKYATGRRIGSSALVSDSMNDAVDVLSGVVALCALGLTLSDPEHFLHADNYGACAIGVIMIATGTRVIRRAGLELMDTMPEPSLVERIRSVACQEPGVKAVEKIHARKTGLQHHVDLHLEVDPYMTVLESHYLGHRVQERVMHAIAQVADVLVHVEPSERRLTRDEYEERFPQKNAR